MLALLQRVTEGSVSIDGVVHARIGRGLVILLGVKKGDTRDGALELADRCSNHRIFEDEEGRMNRSLKETEGSALVVSQFTLWADTRRGNRPGFSDAAPPEVAKPLYEAFVDQLRRGIGGERVATGVFRAMMDVGLVNYGPVTILLESRDRKS